MTGSQVRHALDSSREDSDVPSTASATEVLVVANEDLLPLDELTVVFPRCFSLSYTLFRFGFLPLKPAEKDVVEAEMMQLVGDNYHDPNRILQASPLMLKEKSQENSSS